MVDLKNINKSNLWYVVGLIATDGNLSMDGRHINITSKDRKYLFLVRNALGLSGKVGLKTRGGSKEKIYSNFQFSDVNFYKFLLSIGMTPKKSLTMKKIDVGKEYFKDFLRGVVDGDGCISTWVHKSNLHAQWSLRVTSGAPVFIAWLKNETENNFEVGGKLYKYQYKDKPNPIYILKFGKIATHIILGKIYYTGCLSLNRKHKKSVQCLQDENKFVNYGQVLRSPGGGTGRRSRLKIVRRKACGFDSHPGHI